MRSVRTIPPRATFLLSGSDIENSTSERVVLTYAPPTRTAMLPTARTARSSLDTRLDATIDSFIETDDCGRVNVGWLNSFGYTRRTIRKMIKHFNSMYHRTHGYKPFEDQILNLDGNRLDPLKNPGSVFSEDRPIVFIMVSMTQDADAPQKGFLINVLKPITNGHTTMLIVDNRTNVVYFFDSIPNQQFDVDVFRSIIPYSYNVTTVLFRRHIQTLAEHMFDSNVVDIMRSADRSLYKNTTALRTNILSARRDFVGYCSAWSFFLAFLLLEWPALSVKKALNGIVDRHGVHKLHRVVKCFAKRALLSMQRNIDLRS